MFKCYLGSLVSLVPLFLTTFYPNDTFTSFQSNKRFADDYLDFKEFRLFLKTLRQFFEFYQAFSRYPWGNLGISFVKIAPRIDTGHDNRISREEFTSDTIRDSIETVIFLFLGL